MIFVNDDACSMDRKLKRLNEQETKVNPLKKSTNPNPKTFTFKAKLEEKSGNKSLTKNKNLARKDTASNSILACNQTPSP